MRNYFSEAMEWVIDGVDNLVDRVDNLFEEKGKAVIKATDITAMLLNVLTLSMDNPVVRIPFRIISAVTLCITKPIVALVDQKKVCEEIQSNKEEIPTDITATTHMLKALWEFHPHEKEIADIDEKVKKQLDLFKEYSSKRKSVGWQTFLSVSSLLTSVCFEAYELKKYNAEGEYKRNWDIGYLTFMVGLYAVHAGADMYFSGVLKKETKSFRDSDKKLKEIRKVAGEEVSEHCYTKVR